MYLYQTMKKANDNVNYEKNPSTKSKGNQILQIQIKKVSIL